MQIKAIAKYPFPPKGTGAVRRLAQLSAGKGMKAQGRTLAQRWRSAKWHGHFGKQIDFSHLECEPSCFTLRYIT